MRQTRTFLGFVFATTIELLVAGTPAAASTLYISSLLRNAGAEDTAPMASWMSKGSSSTPYTSEVLFGVASGPTTFSSDSIQATEGSHYFRGGGNFNLPNWEMQSDETVSLSQTVDVSCKLLEWKGKTPPQW